MTTRQAPSPTGMRVAFVDRLRGYRFAAEIRRSGTHPLVHVWHTSGGVVVDLPGPRASDAKLEAMQAAAIGGIVERSSSTTSAFPR